MRPLSTSASGHGTPFVLRAALLALMALAAAPRPVMALELESSLVVAGGVIELEASGASAAASVCFAWIRLPPWPPVRNRLGCSRAGASGVATLRVPSPSVSPGQTIELLASQRGVPAAIDAVLRLVRRQGNVLILLADDLGVDRLGMYAAAARATDAATPNLDALAAEGLRFDMAYSDPNCSPTRASIMTGRRPWRTGVGTALHEEGKAYLRADETTLPEMLDQRTGGDYRHAAVGKWHLGSDKLRDDSALEQGLTDVDGTFNYENNPTVVHGWGEFSGTLTVAKDSAGNSDFFDWIRHEGTRAVPPMVATNVLDYTTIVHVDQAVNLLGQYSAEPDRPWLLYVAFNAPHAPYVTPPSGLGSTCGSCSLKGKKYNAMIETMDTEIGRLLTALDSYPAMAAETTLVFYGDNGTPDVPAEDFGYGPDTDIFKGTIYEGGIHVPLIVRSPLISAASQGTATDAMVHAADFFATVAEIAGVPLSAHDSETRGLDSRSLVPALLDPAAEVREHVVSELFKSPGLREVNPGRSLHHRAIRDADWKLHVEFGAEAGTPPTWTERLYDMRGVEIELEAVEVCSGSGPATSDGARGPAAADCTSQSTEVAAAYRDLRAVEGAIRAEIDPLHGHCGNPSLDCPIPLPVRVMPWAEADFTSGDYAVDRWLRLDAAEAARASGGSLYLQGHGLGYRDGHLDAAGEQKKDGKASVKLGDCDWIDLTNDGPAVLFEPERHYGGIGGGFRTVRLEIPLAGDGCAIEGFNRLQFRFNGTDGVSSGYRVLAFNLHDDRGVAILPPEAFVDDQPGDWSPPYSDSDDLAAGRQYFQQRRSLVDSPVAQVMTNAACSDCHAHDGRDLEYYAYSNESIVNRAVFHGLTIGQGERIASYIRSSPAHRHGRPWAPPYQPGSGVDTRPAAAERWAAGAGLDDVLDDEPTHAAGLLNAIFPRGWADSASIAAQLRGEGLSARTINLRQIPVAIQLPDWNSWLPEKHPLDLWGKDYYDCTRDPLLVTCPPVETPERAYASMRGLLEVGLQSEDVPDAVGALEDAARAWIADGATISIGSEWRTLRGTTLDQAIDRGYANDFVKRSLAQWLAVKYWEVAQEFGLEGLGPKIYPGDGERLSWPFGNHQTVHAVAPHITSNNRNGFERPQAAEIRYQAAEYDASITSPTVVSLYCDDWCFGSEAEIDACVDRSGDSPLIDAAACPNVETCFNDCGYPATHPAQTGLKADYDSTAWYHLQMVLHSGARNPVALGDDAVRPVDWPYALIHVDDLARAVAEETGAEVWESLRYVATLAKAYQMRDNGHGPGKAAWSMRDVSPRLLVGNYRGFAVRDELWDRLDDLIPGHGDLRRRLGQAFLYAFLDITFPESDDFYYSAALAEDFDQWKQRYYDPVTGEDTGHAWWQLDPPEVEVSFRQPFLDAQSDPGLAGTCPQPIEGIGTGDPAATGAAGKQEFPSFDHADHVYRVLPWLTNLGFDPALVNELALWAAEKWPGPVDSPNDWTIPPAGLHCP